MGGSWTLSSSLRAPTAAEAGFVFALSLLRRLVTGGGFERVDILADGTTCSMSIFRFFLGGDFGFINPGGVSGDVLSEVAFAFFAFAFTLACSRRAFRTSIAFFYMIASEKGVEKH